MDYNILTAHLTLEYWIRLKWLDTRLNYSGAVFGSKFAASGEPQHMPVKNMHGDSSHLWVPDIYCYQAADTFRPYSDLNAQIFPAESPGMQETIPWNVNFVRPGKMDVYCKPKMAEFPFDEQNCTIQLGSWAYTVDYMDVSYMTNGFQTLQKFPDSNAYHFEAQREWHENIFYNSTSQTWSVLHIDYRLRRLPIYYLLNAILPMFMMVTLGSLAFWIPLNTEAPGSGERLGYTITCLLTIVAIVFFTADKRPMVGETTWLDTWVSTNLLFTLFPIFETVAVFFLEGVFNNMKVAVDYEEARQERERLENEDKPDLAYRGYRKYLKLVNQAEKEELRGSKKVMFFISCGRRIPIVSPRRIDTFCRNIFPIVVFITILSQYAQIRSDLSVQGRYGGPFRSAAFNMMFWSLVMIWFFMFSAAGIWLVSQSRWLVRVEGAEDKEEDAEDDGSESSEASEEEETRRVYRRMDGDAPLPPPSGTTRESETVADSTAYKRATHRGKLVKS